MTIPFIVQDWLVSPELLKLCKRGREVTVEPMVMDLLLYLVNHAGRLVSKDELLDQVWEGRHVGEDVLTVAISNLRKALGDQARQPTFIQTIPRRGYRLIAEVRPGRAMSRDMVRQAVSWFQQRWPIFAGSCLGLMLLAGLWQGVSKADQLDRPRLSDSAHMAMLGGSSARGYSPGTLPSSFGRLGPLQVPRSEQQAPPVLAALPTRRQDLAMTHESKTSASMGTNFRVADSTQVIPYAMPWPFFSGRWPEAREKRVRTGSLLKVSHITAS